MLKGFVVGMCAAVLLAAAPGYAAQAMPGQDAKDFTLKSIDGKDFKLSSFKDQKAVVLTFWQSACGNCVADMKFLSEQQAKYGNVHFAAINVDFQAGQPAWTEATKKTLADRKVTLEVLLDPKYEIARLYGIGATPSTVMVGKDGKISAVFLGFNPGDEKAVGEALDKLK